LRFQTTPRRPPHRHLARGSPLLRRPRNGLSSAFPTNSTQCKQLYRNVLTKLLRICVIVSHSRVRGEERSEFSRCPYFDGERVPCERTRPNPNWSPARTGRFPRKSISSIFSLCTSTPFSSFKPATILRVAVSITSPV